MVLQKYISVRYSLKFIASKITIFEWNCLIGKCEGEAGGIPRESELTADDWWRMSTQEPLDLIIKPNTVQTPNEPVTTRVPRPHNQSHAICCFSFSSNNLNCNRRPFLAPALSEIQIRSLHISRVQQTWRTFNKYGRSKRQSRKINAKYSGRYILYLPIISIQQS